MFAIIWMGSMKYKTNALYSIDPLQTRKWACTLQWTLWKPKSKLAWQNTEQSQATTQNPFRRKHITHRRPKPQRGYIRVPTRRPYGYSWIRFWTANIFNKTLKLSDFLSFTLRNDYPIKVKHFIFSLARLKA